MRYPSDFPPTRICNLLLTLCKSFSSDFLSTKRTKTKWCFARKKEKPGHDEITHRAPAEAGPTALKSDINVIERPLATPLWLVNFIQKGKKKQQQIRERPISCPMGLFLKHFSRNLDRQHNSLTTELLIMRNEPVTMQACPEKKGPKYKL